MAENLWNDEEAAAYPGDLGARVYTSRLLGRDKSLVLHGGGNTSVKIREAEPLRRGRGDPLRQGERLGPGDDRGRRASRRCAWRPRRGWRRSPRLSDPEMVNELRTAMTLAVRADAFRRGDPARGAAVQVRRPHPRRRGGRRSPTRRTARRSSARPMATRSWSSPTSCRGSTSPACAPSASPPWPGRRRSAWCCSTTASSPSAPRRGSPTSG